MKALYIIIASLIELFFAVQFFRKKYDIMDLMIATLFNGTGCALACTLF